MERTNNINDLLYTVETHKVYDHMGEEIKGKQAMWNGRKYLGVMGKNYSLRQNAELISRIPNSFQFESARLEKDGRKVNAVFVYDHPIEINGHTIKPAINLRNSFDGSTSYQFSGGFFRMICSNGAVVATSFVKAYSRKHVGDFAIDLEYDAVLMEKACQNFFEMSKIQFTREQASAWLTNKVENDGLIAERNAVDIMSIWDTKYDLHNDQNNLWGFYNAITDFSSNHAKSLNHMDKVNQLALETFELVPVMSN
jgi:hypothetical protein